MHRRAGAKVHQWCLQEGPELGAFSLCIRLGWMIRQRIGTGTA